MKKEITDNSKELVECYIELYDIDKKIIKKGVGECSDCLCRLMELKGYVIMLLCEENYWKQIKKEIDDLLWNINVRIDTLKNMELADELNKKIFLKKYREICNPKAESNALVDITEAKHFYIIAVLGIIAIKLLQHFNAIDESDSKYVILFTYIFFLLGRTKKISLDGIQFRKPKNWRENKRK